MTVPSVPTICSKGLFVLWQDPSICQSFRFFRFHSVLPWKSKIHFVINYILLVNKHSIWPSGRDWVVCFYLKALKNLTYPVFLDGFWFVHIPFISSVKFWSLARFQMDNLSHLVVLTFLYPVCTSWRHLVIMWSIVSCLSPHNLHLLIYWV